MHSSFAKQKHSTEVRQPKSEDVRDELKKEVYNDALPEKRADGRMHNFNKNCKETIICVPIAPRSTYAGAHQGNFERGAQIYLL